MRLVSKDGWSIVPQDNSFLYYEDDVVIPSSIRLEYGSIIVTEYENSNIHKFDGN